MHGVVDILDHLLRPLLYLLNIDRLNPAQAGLAFRIGLGNILLIPLPQSLGSRLGSLSHDFESIRSPLVVQLAVIRLIADVRVGCIVDQQGVLGAEGCHYCDALWHVVDRCGGMADISALEKNSTSLLKVSQGLKYEDEIAYHLRSLDLQSLPIPLHKLRLPTRHMPRIRKHHHTNPRM